jgi:hypothetical protein
VGFSGRGVGGVGFDSIGETLAHAHCSETNL